MLKSPIYIVEDDADDIQLLEEVVKKCNTTRPVVFFKTGKELIAYMKQTDQSPFLILCDVNLPGETGFDVKKAMTEDAELKYKGVPFIFWSTSASERQIQQAYDLPAQGFFFKPGTFEQLCETFESILAYWQKSQHPKNVA